MKILTPEPLTAEAFAPFGKVIEADPETAIEINSGFTTRYHALAKVAVGDGSLALRCLALQFCRVATQLRGRRSISPWQYRG